MKKSTIRITGCYAKLSITRAFTMAEILISLTIIGVIAAITLPSLRANINEKTWATQKKALYSRMSQAIAMMPSLNGYGVDPSDENKTANNATMAFINDGLSKVLQINNICDNTNLKKCGLPDKIKTIDGASKITTPTQLSGLAYFAVGPHADTIHNYPQYNYSYSILNTKTAAFETKNGESILVFYNPYCASSEMLFGNNRSYYPSLPYMCANFIYDLNGRKGPNQVGKDIGFIGALYSVNSELVAPNFFKKNLDVTPNTYAEAYAACRDAGGRLPNVEEGIVMFINKYLVGISNSGKQYHLQVAPAIRNVVNIRQSIHDYMGIVSILHHDGQYRVRCVEK